jgi:hypothetical protein
MEIESSVWAEMVSMKIVSRGRKGRSCMKSHTNFIFHVLIAAELMSQSQSNFYQPVIWPTSSILPSLITVYMVVWLWWGPLVKHFPMLCLGSNNSASTSVLREIHKTLFRWSFTLLNLVAWWPSYFIIHSCTLIIWLCLRRWLMYSAHYLSVRKNWKSSLNLT